MKIIIKKDNVPTEEGKYMHFSHVFGLSCITVVEYHPTSNFFSAYLGVAEWGRKPVDEFKDNLWSDKLTYEIQ